MDEKQYLKMRAKAAEEYKKNLEAIDRVWHMSHPDREPPSSKTRPLALDSPVMRALTGQPEPVASNGSKPFSLSETVKEILAELPDGAEISQPIILNRLTARYPELKPRIQKDQIKAQVAGVLSRMAKSNQLLRIRPSHGSEPSVFKKNIVAGLDIAPARPHG